MEFKKGSIVVTKYGEYKLINIMTVYDPSTLNPVTIFVVDYNGVERTVEEKDVIKVINNVENIEES